ncbi:hypothetical protein C489_18796 [Natrinema versiforme JCM 10478]|uniref:DUF8112 domain-containing protein n=1 Tax=Natrinema versiforme JCM 10478 TaxID=1227496 RepID=L9XNY2_9EURY|nr:hypothetical protein C489_18796 [Natrinema versiforme JCM 10478]
MTSDNAGRHQSTTNGALNNETTVTATPEAVLAGHPVGPRANGAVCIGCGEALHETDIVFAYAYRCAEAADWVVSRLYCLECAPSRVRSPTLGVTEVVVGGRLGTIALPTARSHRLCLTELAVRAYSHPTEGCAP